MKVVAAMIADLERTPIGTASRLTAQLGEKTYLQRTVDRLRRCERLDGIFVLCPGAQVDRCSAILGESETFIRSFDAGPPPWATLVRAARKWSLDGWRGGIGGTSHFDEYADSRLLAGLLETVRADAVLAVPPSAPFFDPVLADRMVTHRRDCRDETRLVFTQSPPGLAGVLLDASLIHELARGNVPLGWVLSYKPERPEKDLIFFPSCYEVPAEVRHARGRLVADTDRACETISALHAEREEADALFVGRWLTNREECHVTTLPREVEVELTTEDPYPQTIVRPRGHRVPRRGPIDPAVVATLAEDLARYDDSLIVLGGFGDPLRHPQFLRMLETLRPRNSASPRVYGLAVRTTGVDLDDAIMEALVAHEVDVLCVALDAWSPGLYAELHAAGGAKQADLNDVLGKLDRLGEVKRRRQSAFPIVVPEMTKIRDNVQELDAFHDGWLRRIGSVCISPPNHCAGRFENRAVIRMTPPIRTPCRRIRDRCLVLADGRLTLCDQDVSGEHAVGDLCSSTLSDLWNGRNFDSVRRIHAEARFHAIPLCATCEEWHRP